MSVNIYLLFGPRSQGLLLARCKGTAEERQRRNTQSGGHRMSENTQRSPHTGPSEHTRQQERTDTYSILMQTEQFNLSLLTEEGKREGEEGEGELFKLAKREGWLYNLMCCISGTMQCHRLTSANTKNHVFNNL